MSDSNKEPDDTDYDALQRQNIAAIVFVVLLLGLCVWGVRWLMVTSKIEACVEAGHRNCEPTP